MKKCTGNKTQEWGHDAIFYVKCKNCGELVEFFNDLPVTKLHNGFNGVLIGELII